MRLAVSADLFGQGDDDAFGATEVAEAVHIFVSCDLAEEFGAVGAEAGDKFAKIGCKWHQTGKADLTSIRNVPEAIRSRGHLCRRGSFFLRARP